MYNDSDFDDVATEITEHAMAIGDPQMATTIEEWLTKLTSGDRGLDELNYLRLLQHMMAQRRVTRPFVSPPPEGPLSPLARYLKPPEGQPHDQCEDRSKNGGTDSVVDADGYRGNEEDDDYDVLSYGSTDTFRETTVTGTSVTTADRAGDDTDKDDEDRGGTAGGQDDEAAAAAAAVGSQPWTKRDGHLAAAGETYENGGNRDAKRFDLLCDPCVDGTGPRGREILSGRPLDAAYKSLLGDCALPVFTEADKKNVGSELLRVLQNVNNDTTLQDFYYQVGVCQGRIFRLRNCFEGSWRTSITTLRNKTFTIRWVCGCLQGRIGKTIISKAKNTNGAVVMVYDHCTGKSAVLVSRGRSVHH